MRALGIVVVCASLLAVTPGCRGGHSERAIVEHLNAGGSTFVNPLMQKWADEYKSATGVEVKYQSLGSLAGIVQMTDKTFDFGCTDGPMTPVELEAASKVGGKVVHIPLILGAVVPAYNLKGIDQDYTPVQFTGEILADIYLGKITNWNDPRLRAIQAPGVELPDQEIKVVHRSDGSGTTYVFSEYLAKVSPKWKDKVGFGNSIHFPIGTGGNGNQGVTEKILQTSGALGYVEMTYALHNNIPYGKVKNREGQFIFAGLATVLQAAEGILDKMPDDLRYSITDMPGKDAYPISGTTFAVVYEDHPRKGKAIVDFLRWVIHDGQKQAAKLYYAPLPAPLIDRADKQLTRIRLQ